MFVSTDKEGTVVKGILASLSKSISNMLQYQIDAADISRMLRDQKYEPSGFVSRHPYIKSVSSISDLISKVIDIEMGDFSRCQIKPESYNPVALKDLEEAGGAEYAGNFIGKGEGERIYGETCPTCNSSNLLKNGTCKVCQDCGSTTGCS